MRTTISLFLVFMAFVFALSSVATFTDPITNHFARIFGGLIYLSFFATSLSALYLILFPPESLIYTE